jgi:hypothetical protein
MKKHRVLGGSAEELLIMQGVSAFLAQGSHMPASEPAAELRLGPWYVTHPSCNM